ncbi:MAG: TMEM165/GDT1 family protein [Candidatus Methylomirabilis sp.]|nr:TMEM165/GDT1 family protein [Deltaproteobacteria bacterium]
MDPKLFASTFSLIFLAELGDKTQLATLTLAATASQRWTVFAAASLALVAASALGVLVGGAVGQYVQGPWVKRAAGALFVAIGVLYLLDKG